MPDQIYRSCLFSFGGLGLFDSFIFQSTLTFVNVVPLFKSIILVHIYSVQTTHYITIVYYVYLSHRHAYISSAYQTFSPLALPGLLQFNLARYFQRDRVDWLSVDEVVHRLLLTNRRLFDHVHLATAHRYAAAARHGRGAASIHADGAAPTHVRRPAPLDADRAAPVGARGATPAHRDVRAPAHVGLVAPPDAKFPARARARRPCTGGWPPRRRAPRPRTCIGARPPPAPRPPARRRTDGTTRPRRPPRPRSRTG